MAGNLIVNYDRIKQRIEAVNQFGKAPEGGWSRFSFSEPYEAAVQLVTKYMEEAGMTVERDAAGNTVGCLVGKDNSAPAVCAGSHLDTVKNGGMFDGVAGVISAVEAATVISENNFSLTHSLKVFIFIEEEGGRFGNGLFGSRARAGLVDEDIYRVKDNQGKSLAEVMSENGLKPEKLPEAEIKSSEYKSYFELHIEQARVLEESQKTVGVVEGIAGFYFIKVVIFGRSDHAGATPMDLRSDALVPAAKIIAEVENIVNNLGGKRTVATVGKINVYPGATNIIPGKVEFNVDVRDLEEKYIQLVIEEIKKMLAQECKTRNLQYSVEKLTEAKPVKLPESKIDLLESICLKRNIPHKKLISGAAHDAQIMAGLMEVGMLFVPSLDGISHNPEENSRYEDIAEAAQVLCDAIIKEAG